MFSLADRESDEADAKLVNEHRRRVEEEERKRAEKLKVTNSGAII